MMAGPFTTEGLPMLSLFATLLLAPVPVGPALAAQPPQIHELTADADGKVRILVYRKETTKVAYTYTETVDGNTITKIGEKDQQVPVVKRVLLSEIKDLSIATADGKDVDRPVLLKKLEEGGAAVVISADGKKIAPKFLKLFRDDAIVLTADELLPPKPQIVSTPVRRNGIPERLPPVLVPLPAPAPPGPPPAGPIVGPIIDVPLPAAPPPR